MHSQCINHCQETHGLLTQCGLRTGEGTWWRLPSDVKEPASTWGEAALLFSSEFFQL